MWTEPKAAGSLFSGLETVTATALKPVLEVLEVVLLIVMGVIQKNHMDGGCSCRDEMRLARNHLISFHAMPKP